jgi:hypothetical protein
MAQSYIVAFFIGIAAIGISVAAYYQQPPNQIEIARLEKSN